jgi:hypothetical protein
VQPTLKGAIPPHIGGQGPNHPGQKPPKGSKPAQVELPPGFKIIGGG